MAEARFQSISDDLKERIVAKELQGRLPGIIRLCDMYHAGQSTVKRAVQQLVDDGFLVIDGTRGTFIADKFPTRERTGVIAIIGQFFWGPESQNMLNRINKYINNKGFTIIQINSLSELAKKRPKILAQMPCDGFMVFGLTNEFAAAIKMQGKGLVSLNKTPDIPVSFVDFDWDSEVEKVLVSRIKAGHKKIAFVLWESNRFGFRDHMFKVYERVMRKYNLFDPDYFYAKLNPGEIYEKYGDNYREYAAQELLKYFKSLDIFPSAGYFHFFHHDMLPLLEKIREVKPEFEAVNIGNSKQLSIPYVKMDYYDLITRAADILISEIESNKHLISHEYSKVHFCK